MAMMSDEEAKRHMVRTLEACFDMLEDLCGKDRNKRIATHAAIAAWLRLALAGAPPDVATNITQVSDAFEESLWASLSPKEKNFHAS